MSLRLLPAITMDNDEDDDGNFTKWMSSYWGHGAESGHSRDRKRSFRRPARSQTDRRGSLPTVFHSDSGDTGESWSMRGPHCTPLHQTSQLDAMKLNKLHAATMAPSPSHLKTREEWLEVRPHPRARRTSSDDGRPKTAILEARISTIPEITGSLEKRLRTISLNEDNRLCLICYEDMRKNGAGTQELHCTHRFHKEAMRRLDQPCRSSEAGHIHTQTEERRKSADGHISNEKDPPFHRQLSLRKHR